MLLIFGALLIVSLFSLKLTDRLNMPILLVFLIIGFLAGSDVLNLVAFDDMYLCQQIANVALIFIIFDSGFNLKRETVRNIMAPSLILATAGVVATAALIGLFVHFAFKMQLARAFLIGSIISSTDASAVLAAIRKSPVRPRVANTLVFESAANDPIAIILTIFFINIIKFGSGGNVFILMLKLCWQLGGGALVGVACGWAGVWLFKRLKPENRGFYYILIIGICLFSYGLADLLHANGIISVFFCGILMGNTRFAYKRGVSGFLGGISAFANISLFLLLGLLAFPKQLPPVLNMSLAIALFTIFAARTVVIACVAPFFKYSFREGVFLCFAGIKGAVPIVLSTYPAAYGLDPSHSIFNVVFVIVLISLGLQGTMVSPVSRWLKLDMPPERKSEHSFELLSVDDSSIDIYERAVGEGSRYVGKKLMDLGLPEEVSVTAVIREGKILIPRGKTKILKGDILYILATEEQYQRLET
jgi:cell volume regulation protein A